MKREFVCPLCFSRMPLEKVIKHCPQEEAPHNGPIRLGFFQKLFGTAIGELTCDACKEGKDDTPRRKTLVDGIFCPDCLQKNDGTKHLRCPYRSHISRRLLTRNGPRRDAVDPLLS